MYFFLNLEFLLVFVVVEGFVFGRTLVLVEVILVGRLKSFRVLKL